MGNILQTEIEKVLNKLNCDFLNNKTILVVGANGFIGKIFSLTLIELLKKNVNLKIILLSRDLNKLKNNFDCYKNKYPKNIFYEILDIIYNINIKSDIDYILNTASITKSIDMINNPVDVINVNICGLKNLLDLATKKKLKIIHLSSMEVIGIIEKNEIFENDFGIIDGLKIRNCYPLSKKLAENLCLSYYSQFNTNTIVLRLPITIGGGFNDDDNRVFQYFINCIKNKKDIILKSKGKTRTSKIYIFDVIFAILILFKNGISGECYNAKTDNLEYSIFELGKIIKKKYNINLIINENDRNITGYSDVLNINFNCDKIKQLGFKTDISIDEILELSIGY